MDEVGVMVEDQGVRAFSERESDISEQRCPSEFSLA